MTATKAAVGIVVLLVLAVIGTLVVLFWQRDMPAVTGALVGAGLGGIGLCVEAFSLSWALRNKPAWTLGVSLGGFFSRMVVVVVLIFVFRDVESVSVWTFALTYVASFLAFVGIQVWAVNRMMVAAKPAGPEQKEGEALSDG